MRKYYSEFVGHCVRFYVRNLTIKYYRSKADELNYLAVKDCFEELSAEDKDIITECFIAKDFPAQVKEVAKRNALTESKVWEKIGDFEESVAKRRGII